MVMKRVEIGTWEKIGKDFRKTTYSRMILLMMVFIKHFGSLIKVKKPFWLFKYCLFINFVYLYRLEL